VGVWRSGEGVNEGLEWRRGTEWEMLSEQFSVVYSIIVTGRGT
jgi:hypothetical protein